MASDEDIQASVGEMLAYVQEAAPVLRPAIFLRGKVPRSPMDLSVDEEQRALIGRSGSNRKEVYFFRLKLTTRTNGSAYAR